MNSRSPIPKESKDMNSALPHHPIPANLKSKLANLSATISSAIKRSLVALAGCLVMTQTGLGQIVTFEFSALAGNENSAISNTNATGLTSSTITRGPGLSAGENSGRYNAINWATTSIANAITGNDYMEFTITPNAGKQFTVSTIVVQWQRSSSGNTAIALRSSVDAYATDIDTVKTVTDNTSTQTFTWTVTQAARSTAVTYRLYSFAEATTGSGGPGDGAGNDITVNGAVTDAAPAPTFTAATLTTPLSTTYGTASSGVSFTAAGANLTANITASAEAGYEVSTSENSGYTSSVSVASGTQVWVRFAANRAAGNYNTATAITLSSTNATSVNITTSASGNTVTAKPLSITAAPQNKFYGSESSLGNSSFTSDGLANSETIGAVTLSSAGSAAAASVGSYPITPSNATGGTFAASNYTVTYNTGTLTVNPKPLTITANAITKAFGETLASPITGSTAFTSDGLVNSDTIGSVTISYGTGAASSDAAGIYADQVTPSLAVGGTFNMGNYTPTYLPASLTVTADPTITLNGTLSAVDTIYGTASSSPSSFTVSGIFLTGDLTVTPPAGFEVSTSLASGYTTTLTVPASSTLNSTTVYLRLASTTAFGTYTGNITVAGGGAASKTIATASSNVAKKALSITGLTGNNKPYDRTAAATTSGTATYVGLENGEVFAVTGAPTASFADANAAPAKPITITGYTAPSANYSVSQPTGLTAEITPLALTVTGSTVTTRAYNTTEAATITGATLVGVISPDVVTIATSTGTFATANAGTGISVTANLTLGGTNAGNYSIIQPTGLVGNITKADQTITFADLPERLTSDAPFTLTATASSGLTVSFASSAPSVASVSGVTVTIFGFGTTNITASQAGDTNYNSVTRIRPLKVSPPILKAWDLTGANGTATATATITSLNLDSENTITRGSTAAASPGNNSFRTLGFQNNGISTANTDFFQTTLSASPGFALSLASIDATFAGTSTFRASPGVSAQFAYSLDGTTFTLIGSPFILTQDTSMPQVSLSLISELQNVPASTTVTIRYYASGQTTTGGWGFSSPSAGSYGLRFGGDVIIAPSITGAATTTAFTTTYGAPSAEQSFSISGAALTADLIATAPSGFELSSDGTTYAATATFPQSSGTASGSLRIRLAADAPASGDYNSRNIVLTSTGATPVNIVTAASGNLVSKAASTITSSPTASSIVSGQTLASSTLSGGSASVAGGFTFTSPSTAPSVGTSTHQVTFTPTDASNYNTASTTVSVTVTSAYATWSSSFLPGFTDTATTSNPDLDSLSNLLEFAFGTNPTVSNSGPITHSNGIITTNGQPTTSITNTTNSVDYRAVFGRRKDYLAAGLTYTVQFSAGLDVWVDSTDTPTVVASDATMDAVTVPYPLFITTTRGVEKPTFFRVAVSSN